MSTDFVLTSPPDNAPGIPCPSHTTPCRACDGTGTEVVNDEECPDDPNLAEEYECEECNGEGERYWSWQPTEDEFDEGTRCNQCGVAAAVLDDWSDEDMDEHPMCRSCAVVLHARDCGCGTEGWS